jgi:hypothetical protein
MLPPSNGVAYRVDHPLGATGTLLPLVEGVLQNIISRSPDVMPVGRVISILVPCSSMVKVAVASTVGKLAVAAGHATCTNGGITSIPKLGYQK